MNKIGYIRWVSLTTFKGVEGVETPKPRVLMDILVGKDAQGLYRVFRVGFEAPNERFNIPTPEGVENIAVDQAAFLGLTLEMIHPEGEPKFQRYGVGGKLEATNFENAIRVTQRLRIEARVKLENLAQNLHAAQRWVKEDVYDPIPDEPCKVRIGDIEYPGIRESYTLARCGKIELIPLVKRSFRANNDNAMVLS